VYEKYTNESCLLSGGCAAQEAIKFITGQYKPVNNTFIYDAITSNTATFAL
jgi:amyloid beta precursor protein binding protein 1